MFCCSKVSVGYNRYLYNGKEQMEGTGLYAYGFRYYDPVIGRFTGVDPIADKFAFVSPYNYAENSPIANIDLHGLQKYDKTRVKPDDSALTRAGKATRIIFVEFWGTVWHNVVKPPLEWVGNQLPNQGTPSAEDFHDPDSGPTPDGEMQKTPGGITVLSNSDLKAGGTLDTEDGTSTSIVEEGDFTGNAPDAGGANGDAANGNNTASKLYNFGLSIKQGKAAVENLPKDPGNSETKVDTTFKLGDYTITRKSPKDD